MVYTASEGGDQGPDSGTKPQHDALSQGDAHVTYTQAEGQSAHAPEHPEEHNITSHFVLPAVCLMISISVSVPIATRVKTQGAISQATTPYMIQ